LFGVEGLDEKDGKESGKYLDSLFEDYHNLDTAQNKGRFRYENVPSDDFGLTNEDILMLDDKQLNTLVSIKKYRPYRTMKEDGQEDPNLINKQVNVHAVIHKKQQFKQEIKDNIETLKQLQAANLEAEKSQHLKQRAVSAKEHKKQKKEKKRSREEAGLPEQSEENAGDDAAEKKRKRMALYGV